MVGESVTFTATGTDNSPEPNTYRFGYDGPEVKPDQVGPSNTWTTSFSTPQTGSVFVSYEDGTPGHDPASGNLNIEVVPQLDGSIGSSNDSPVAGGTVSLSASGSGGKGGLSFEWDFDGDGFDDASGTATTVSYPDPGPRQVRVRIRDSAAPAHEIVRERTLNVQPAPNCEKKAAFGIAEVTTQGCLRRVGGTYETTDAVKLNGIPFAAPGGGRKFVATLPRSGLPGGRVALADTVIRLGSLTVFRGDVDWDLPAGGQGDERGVATLGVPSGAEVFGLPVTGSVAFKLGFRADGTHYATFPLNIALPSIFKAGPDGSSGGVTGNAAVRVDDGGVRYDGLKLAVRDAWIGKLKVESVCFSYVPAGGQAVAPCEVPELDGQPYITCNEDVNTDRWDGNAVVVLPTPSRTRLAAFGGVAGNRLSKLGGFVDNLGTTLPITESVFVNRIGVGLCIHPPPFKLRGDVGIAFLPPPGVREVLAINGFFIYTDAFGPSPWSLELGGSVEIYDTLIGRGSLILRPNGSFDFGVTSGFDLYGVASINGSVRGWLEIPTRRFNLDGNVTGRLGPLTARADAVFSTTGLGACVEAGRIVWWEAVKRPSWRWYLPWEVDWVRREFKLHAGFGHRWTSSTVDLFGGSCYLDRYRAVRTLPAVAAARGVRIPKGAPAAALRIQGANAPPKVTVKGPDGTTIVSPADSSGAQRRGKWMLVENPSDNSTNVLLVRPRGGRWTVDGEGITGVRTAGFAPPTQVEGAVVKARRGRRRVSLAYFVPRGASLSLVESGRGIHRTIARNVKQKRCRRNARGPAGMRLRCASVTFRPGFGPGGRRSIVAVVTRGGMPLDNLTVARFRAPRPSLPSRAKRLRLIRKGSGVLISWGASRGASRYSVSVRASDGRRLGYDLGPRCRAVRIGRLARRGSLRVRVQGIRRDFEGGKAATGSLRAGKKRFGPKPPRRARPRVCR